MYIVLFAHYFIYTSIPTSSMLIPTFFNVLIDLPHQKMLDLRMDSFLMFFTFFKLLCMRVTRRKSSTPVNQ